MGNNTIKDSLHYDRKKEYTFMGRQNEINEIKELLESNDIVQMYGMSKIGKSRLLIQLLDGFCQQRTCFYHDFKEDNLEKREVLIKLLGKFIAEVKEIAADKNERNMKSNSITAAILQVKDTLKSYGANLTKPMLFLDNLDMGLKDKSIKGDILTTLREISSMKEGAVKVLFTTSEKIIIPIKTFNQIEVGPLDDNYIAEILREIIEAKGTTMAEDFDFGEEILSDENKVYLDIIVRQCEGLPFIAIMVAMELTADEGLFTPADMIQLLFTQRVKSLSLEYYPPQDRIDLLKRDIEKVKDLDKYFLQTLNQNLDENNRNSIESLRSEMTKHDEKTSVDIKKCFRLLTHPCIVRYLGKSREIDMHAIFRQCICDMTGTDSIDDNTFRKLLMDSAKRYGLDLTDRHIDSPRLLEEYVNKLGETENSYETIPGFKSGEQKSGAGSSHEKDDESKEDKHGNIPSPNTCFIAQPTDNTDEIKMCNRVEKVEQFEDNYSNDLGLSETSVKSGNVVTNNVNLRSCRPKMNDLKAIHSIEDNTLVPAEQVQDNLFMKTSSFMRTSLDLPGRPHSFPDEAKLENSAPSSPEHHVTSPKLFNVTPDLSACGGVTFTENNLNENVDVQFNRLSMSSLLNTQFPRNQLLLHKKSDKLCSYGVQNKSVDENDVDIESELKNNIPNFDTLLTVSDATKQVHTSTQTRKPKGAESLVDNIHMNSESDVVTNIEDLDFDTLLDSTDSAKLHRLKSLDVGVKECRSEKISENLTNQLAMTYRDNQLNCHVPKETSGTKENTNSSNTFYKETNECNPSS